MTFSVADAVLVLVVSDREEMAMGLRAILSGDCRTERVNSQEAFSRLQRPPVPALVLIDMLHPSLKEVRLVSRIRSLYPGMRVQILSTDEINPWMPAHTTQLEARFLDALKNCLQVGEEPGDKKEASCPGSELSAEAAWAGLPAPETTSDEDASEPRASDSHGLKSLLRSLKGEAEKTAIASALEQTRWNRKRAAQLLHISYRGLLYKIDQYHLCPTVPSPSSPARNRKEK
jgi:DNA-binding NtrC family response regulator